MEASNAQQRDDAATASKSEAVQTAAGSQDGAEAESKSITASKSPQLSSLATSLSIDLIEMIMSILGPMEVIMAAAYLPQAWREVVEASFLIRKKLRELHYFDDTRSNGHMEPGSPFWFSSSLEHGILFVWHFMPGWESLIFAPFSIKARLRILEPGTKVVEYRKDVRGHDSLYIKLFDLEGNLVCERGINDNNRDALWRYATKVCGQNEI